MPSMPPNPGDPTPMEQFTSKMGNPHTVNPLDGASVRRFHWLPPDATPAANTAATMRFDPEAERRHLIGGVCWSYSAAPAGGRLTIGDGQRNAVDVDIIAGGPGSLLFNPPLVFPINAPVILTLAAGGAGITGKVAPISYEIGGGE